ncbi:MAG: hypothetical protein JW965_03945 [Bacteroidales bacterium]|nr:hypothetical protein [Bacteroidales bacterium]
MIRKYLKVEPATGILNATGREYWYGRICLVAPALKDGRSESILRVIILNETVNQNQISGQNGKSVLWVEGKSYPQMNIEITHTEPNSCK